MNFEKMRCELHLLSDDGDRVSNEQLKSLLKKPYRKYGTNRIITGTQIKEFGFTTHKRKILTENGRLDGQELIRIK